MLSGLGNFVVDCHIITIGFLVIEFFHACA